MKLNLTSKGSGIGISKKWEDRYQVSHAGQDMAAKVRG
jgi:hypothetical protein